MNNQMVKQEEKEAGALYLKIPTCFPHYILHATFCSGPVLSQLFIVFFVKDDMDFSICFLEKKQQRGQSGSNYKQKTRRQVIEVVKIVTNDQILNIFCRQSGQYPARLL